MLFVNEWQQRLLLSLKIPFTFWSNINVCHFEHLLEIYPAFRNYDVLSSGLSFELHLKKPDAEFFEACCKSARHEPSAILFLDDTIDHVNAAKRMGIDA